MKEIAKIIIVQGKQPLDYVFDYQIPSRLLPQLQVGMRVKLPFGRQNKTVFGYVIGIISHTVLDENKLKEISSIIDEEPILSQTMIDLAYFMSEKYFTSLPQCLMTILPSSLQAKKANPLEKIVKVVSLLDNLEAIAREKEINSKRRDVICFLEAHGPSTMVEIRKAVGVSNSPMETLEKRQIVSIVDTVFLRDVVFSIEKDRKHILTSKQNQVVEAINQRKLEGTNKPILLHGVTGSGKTEIYMEAIEAVVRDGKEAIVLVPEIALTPQLVNRFHSRFHDLVSVTHSRLSEGERLDQWRKARNGDIKIMIGPRSAIFSPFQQLGMIIIDEEHEQTYQSDQNPKYDVREIAKKLAELTNAQLILGSATPALETYYGTVVQKTHLLTMEERVNSSMPQVHIADMRAELSVGNQTIFSRLLFNEITQALDNNKQVLLFLNRRGHSTFISCRHCGDVHTCSDCSVNFTYHQPSNRLICHYCGKEVPVPRICSVCGSPHVKFFGLGTQKVAEEVSKYFPKAKVLRMDYDTTRGKGSHEKIYNAFLNQEANILIGTQMIAKGLDFPHVHVVGVIAADLSLYTGDFRSSERTFQLITQVAGRAGRREKKGQVIIQTYSPEHFSFKHAKEHDYIHFFNEEIVMRQAMVYPPFAHFFSILLLSPNEKELIETAFRLQGTLREDLPEYMEILGPSPAYVVKVRNDFRWTLLIKAIDEKILREYVLEKVEAFQQKEPKATSIRLQLTINPQHII